jgi:hypothetical protein
LNCVNKRTKLAFKKFKPLLPPLLSLAAVFNVDSLSSNKQHYRPSLSLSCIIKTKKSFICLCCLFLSTTTFFSSAALSHCYRCQGFSLILFAVSIESNGTSSITLVYSFSDFFFIIIFVVLALCFFFLSFFYCCFIL